MRPLEPQHGAPVRLLVPGWYGMASVKWLTRVTAVAEPFQGYQQRVAYRYQQDADDPGEGVNRMRVRALMVPPGHPDFLTRARFVTAGEVELRGRAWSGSGVVERVEVGVDGVWGDAELEPPLGDFAWRGWRSAGWRSPAIMCWRAGPPMPPARSSRSSSPGTTRAWATTSCRRSASRSARAEAAGRLALS